MGCRGSTNASYHGRGLGGKGGRQGVTTAGRRLNQDNNRLPTVDVAVNISTYADVAWSQLDHLRRSTRNAELATAAGIQGTSPNSPEPLGCHSIFCFFLYIYFFGLRECMYFC